MRRVCQICAVTIAVLGFCSAESAGAHLRGRIVRVGFSGRGSGLASQVADYYRPGYWTPIVVELTEDNGDGFTGRLEVRQADRDGDLPTAEVPVSFQGTKRYQLYIPAGVEGFRGRRVQSRFRVRVFSENGQLAPLFDDEGKPLKELTLSRESLPISAETTMILEVGATSRINWNGVLNDDRLLRDLLVARLAPEDLPDNVAGLEMIDVIVWDGTDPTTLKDPTSQLPVLIDWMNRGGTLVLAVSRNWQEVNSSRLGELLPVRLKGKVSIADNSALPDDLNDQLFGAAGVQREFDPPLQYCPVTLESLRSDAVPVVPTRPDPEDVLLVTRRPHGNGFVVLVAAEMGDLFLHSTQQDSFLRQVLTVRRRLTEQGDNYGTFGGMSAGETDLFRHVESQISFQVIAAWYFLFAFAFVITYIVLATLGSWNWLKRRQMIRRSWLAFAAIAIGASAFSLLAVWMIRGIGYSVEEFTVINGRAGVNDVTTTSYFGLKSASHTEVDLSVPVDWLHPDDSFGTPATLRPLAPDPEAMDRPIFSAGQPYQVLAGPGEIHQVPLRATLKQFEAFWEGPLSGRLNASLEHARPSVGGLRDDSWIQNDLATDLDECFLLVANREFRQRYPHRSNVIDVYDIGRLPAGQKVFVNRTLASNRRERTSAVDRVLGEDQEPRRNKPRTLDKYQGAWINKFLTKRNFGDRDQREPDVRTDLETFASAVLLLSTFEEIPPTEFDMFSGDVRRSQGQRLDCSARLTPDHALFVGFSEDPGPARLCVRKAGRMRGYKAIEPSKSRVVYRISIPIASSN